tara:strand:- start:12626 stop:12862 length:237 start_codon:yes stop_codon:yes gene_type:complete
MGNPSGKFGEYEFKKSVGLDWSNLLLAMSLAGLGVILAEVLPILHQLGPRWGVAAAIATPLVRALMEWLKNNKHKPIS